MKNDRMDGLGTQRSGAQSDIPVAPVAWVALCAGFGAVIACLLQWCLTAASSSAGSPAGLDTLTGTILAAPVPPTMYQGLGAIGAGASLLYGTSASIFQSRSIEGRRAVIAVGLTHYVMTFGVTVFRLGLA
ncbi:hypothetical protein [Acidovorax sp. sic0104]|uniref:hypothetical protein n=1 Tax=Acidovorax sp. sic0104 TaxID=2854784 RepID=UPI001C46BE35|nr:hypothetical protein [Acidovorax sp. sic0104]MBV7542210.1 hypothetical protein [Acidovorax sp. sic0104]